MESCDAEGRRFSFTMPFTCKRAHPHTHRRTHRHTRTRTGAHTRSSYLPTSIPCRVGGRTLSPLPVLSWKIQMFPTTHGVNMVVRTKTKTITPPSRQQKASFQVRRAPDKIVKDRFKTLTVWEGHISPSRPRSVLLVWVYFCLCSAGPHRYDMVI